MQQQTVPYLCTIGLSGGVDSSVAACLLQEQGYDVSAVFMQNWKTLEDDCPLTEDYQRAMDVAAYLGIPLAWVDGSEQYYQKVFTTFLHDLEKGYTPNPDIWCNEFVKFDILLSNTPEHGMIATGHYARVESEGGVYSLKRAVDLNKDQSYFLSRLNPSYLPRILFPLGHLTKPQVRVLARQKNLSNAEQKESMGICFIGPNHFKTFLEHHLISRKGDIVTDRGDVIGRHDGLMYYTLGQRKGLGIGGLRHYDESPWYVIDKLLSDNVLVVSQQSDHPKLTQRACLLRDMHYFEQPPEPHTPLLGQSRHRQTPIPCQIEASGQAAHVVFKESPWALTPGQHVVCYDGDKVICSGIIEKLLAEV